jgi:hypothetical protein
MEKKDNKPHCWGKMDWILKYEDGHEPKESICNCEHGAYKCKSLTRINNQNETNHDYSPTNAH